MPSPTTSPALHDLEAYRDEIAALRVDGLFAADPGRGPALTFACAGLAVDFSKQRLTAATLGRLAALARERDFAGAVARLFAGELVNNTEGRPALHTALRGEERVMAGGEDVLAQVQRCRERMRVFATAVRDGSWKGATGEPVRHVLSLGIGGSYLGPRLAVEALCAAAEISFSWPDPRVGLIPLSQEEAAKLGSKIYRISPDPYKFQDAVLVGTAEAYYGECRFEIDPTTPLYLKLDNNFLRGLFGKFNPSRGDLVLSRTGELLGVMANSSYCMMIQKFDSAATFHFGADVRSQKTGETLSRLYAFVTGLPNKLQ